MLYIECTGSHNKFRLLTKIISKKFRYYFMFRKSLIEFFPEINLMWEHAVLITDTERVEVITVIDMYQQRRTNNRIFITKIR